MEDADGEYARYISKLPSACRASAP